MTPEQVIDEIRKAGLRGRGGAGFLTGVKWGLCRAADGSSKYLVCNADEGDPGAFMDRSLLEGTPHAIIEGMMIAAYAIGASHGIIYVRAEYPMAVRHSGSPSSRRARPGSWARTSSEPDSISTSRSTREAAPSSAVRKRP